MRVLEAFGPFRILEVQDHDNEIENLKGDCFRPNDNPEIDPRELRKQELFFEVKVQNLGVFGYILEVWNPKIGHGWTHVDSCYGFIGPYNSESKEFNHYIVEELKQVSKNTFIGNEKVT
jgi:hypothetical protein